MWNESTNIKSYCCSADGTLVCVSCVCSWKTAVFLHDGCQCVLSTRYIVPESGGSTTVLHQCRTQQMLARSWRLPNMQTLSLFICFLMTPPGASQEGIFLCRFRRKRGHLSIICHWHIKVRGLKVWKSSFCLRWMPLKVFTLILISACVILPPLTRMGTHLCCLCLNAVSLFCLIHPPPPTTALIRVMPAHHGAVWATRRIMGLHTGYSITCSWVSKGEGGAASPSCLCKRFGRAFTLCCLSAKRSLTLHLWRYLGHFPDTSWLKSNRAPATLMCW